MLSTSCKYAIRAAMYLMANADEQHKVGVKEIAKEIGANEHTTGKILQLLVRQKIIFSLKGPQGGFYIRHDAKPVYLIDIVKLVDGMHFFVACGLGLHRCSEEKPCPIHFSFKASREKLLREFSSLTIKELAFHIEKGEAFLKR